MLTSKYRRNDGLRKLPFNHHHCDESFRQQLMDVKAGGRGEEQNIGIISEYLPIKYLSCTKEIM